MPVSAKEAPLLELKGVERTYYVDTAPVHALQGINLRIEPGKLVIIKGPSGSGKTTVLNIMGGLDRASAGDVVFQGKNLKQFSDRQLTRWRRHQVGFIFQTSALIQILTAFENVELPLRICRVRWKERQQKVNHYLDLVGLNKRGHHRTFELSGGEQQRVGIARALVNEPNLILADEPTGEVDFTTGVQIMQLFRELVENSGVTICMATHDPAFMEYGDLALEISDGQIVG